MRLATALTAVCALAGAGLADIDTVRASLFDLMDKVSALNQTMAEWPGDVVSGGNVVCKTLELRKSLKACARAFATSKPLRNGDVSPQKPLPLVRLAVALFDLKDQAVAAKPRLDAVGASPAIYEVLRAQKRPASELSRSMEAILNGLPPSIRDARLPALLRSAKVTDYIKNFLSNEINDTLSKFDPGTGKAASAHLRPFIRVAVRFSASIDPGPFCQALPPLLALAGAQRSVRLGELATKVLAVLETAGVQDQIPLNIIRANAKAFGVPADTIPKLLGAFGVKAKGVPLRTFTDKIPSIIQDLGLQDLEVDPSKMAKFIDLFVKKAVGRKGGKKNPASPKPA